jgi:hypothetical protein
MEMLIRLAREDETIQRIASAAMENRGVQGVALDLDAYWLTAWNYMRRFGSDAAVELRRRRYDHPFSSGWQIGSDEFLTDLPENLYPALPLEISDLKWRPSEWKYRAEMKGFEPEQSPVRITICLRPGAAEIPSFELGPYRVLYETRPVATLSASPRKYRRPVVGGLSAGVGTKQYGTMGGIVRDGQSPPQKYGVTCAHVMTAGTVDQPAQVDSRRAVGIGTVSKHTPLTLPTGICTPVSTSGLNTVDVALIEIDGSTTNADLEVLDIGPLTGITPISKIGQGQLVEFTGRNSGNRMLRVGALNIIYEMNSNGKTYCFQNVIQLNWPKFYQLFNGRPVSQGDSGAWICNPNENGFGWCGMIIGDDRLHGYAIYAETIEKWWQQQGLNLTVT